MSLSALWFSAIFSILLACFVHVKFVNGVCASTPLDNSLQKIEMLGVTMPRFDLAAAKLNSKVFFAGGWNKGILNDVDIYDAASDSWSKLYMQYSRRMFVAITVESNIYFAGGNTNSKNIFYPKEVEMYSSNTNSMVVVNGGLSVGRYLLSAAVAGQFLLFGGGADVNAPDSASTGLISNVVDIYNLKNKTWTTSNLSEGRYSMAAVSYNNLAIFTGGITSKKFKSGSIGFEQYTLRSFPSKQVDIFNSLTGTWTTTSMSMRRADHAALRVEEIIIIAGGVKMPNYDQEEVFFDVVDLYNISSKSWSMTKFPVNESSMTGSVIGCNAVFISTYNSRNVYVFDTFRKVWNILYDVVPFPISRFAFVSFSKTDNSEGIMLVGGIFATANPIQVNSAVLKFEFSKNTPVIVV